MRSPPPVYARPHLTRLGWSWAGGVPTTSPVSWTEPAWWDRVRPAHGGVDVVVDAPGGSLRRAAFELLRRGGRFSAFGMAGGIFADVTDDGAARRQVTVVRGARLTPAAMLELTRAALTEAVAGRPRPVIGQTFPLERAAEAYAAIEARATLGKTLLLVGNDTGVDGVFA